MKQKQSTWSSLIYSGQRRVIFIGPDGEIPHGDGTTTSTFRALQMSSIAFKREAHEPRWRLMKYRYDYPWCDQAHTSDAEFTDEDIAMIRLGADPQPIVNQRFQEFQDRANEQTLPEWFG